MTGTKFGLSAAAVLMFSAAASAQDVSILQADTDKMSLSIYNQNLAMVRDSRRAFLPAGVFSAAFEGVASQMQPETALLQGEGLKVLEQNYEYDLLTPANILEEAVGKKVKTVTVNPSDGSNIFDEAVIVSSNYGQPILKFSYGVETAFPGRIVFETLPENLRIKPTLAARIENAAAGSKELSLSYLTGGINWTADYSAEIRPDYKMNLQGWVTLTNQSGADYKNAEVQLVAGEVNQVAPVRPRAAANMLMAKSAAFDGVAESAASGSLQPQSFSGYYVYTLPEKTDVMDKQTKQVSLMNLSGVGYAEELKLVSPLTIGAGSNAGVFEKANPQMIYKIKNSPENNLGTPLPSGTVRFYTKQENGGLTFMGAAELPRLAVGEEAELSVGRAFDVYAGGKVVSMKKIADKLYAAEAEVTFGNASDKEQTVVFEQHFYNDAEVVSESLPSEKNRARVLSWTVKIPAGGQTVLTYKVNLVQN